jgi:hypothetical protein
MRKGSKRRNLKEAGENYIKRSFIIFFFTKYYYGDLIMMN